MRDLFPNIAGVSQEASVLYAILSGRARGLLVPPKRVPRHLRAGLAELEKAGLAAGTPRPDGKVAWRAIPRTESGGSRRLRLIQGEAKSTEVPPPRKGAA